MTTIPTPLFSYPLGEDAILIPRTAAITDAYHDLVVANVERLARWEPWATKPQVLEETRSFLDSSGRNWLNGSELPVAIAVMQDGGWQLAGALSLIVSRYSRSAEIGYWIGADFEGRGLVTRAAAAMLDQAFGPLDLDRVSLHTDPSNERSRAVARRLGFVEEGVLRQGTSFPDGRRDEIVYGLLAQEWRNRSAG